ncbi:MAG: Polyribonucleotide nucleotidyltransferase [Candidatus Falkowbacteria bacterium GW2011_GWA2_39_24]|uniref:Polyribonucleotide nucleotidyltransferase n=1 Tax=Candidatus Falkowbacteria bacterium GW2011_GWA2_39_24 TaxID=1618634 RepID=A0A0G0RMZ2_9BACT|nr:MAG: Polyribonucleotide nucleotidyltransferase [Candidatus Falkowbacteria bacterium GW2011_GWA2_39_24]
MSKEHVFECDWLGRPLTIKTGKLARQADAAVTVQYGETVVLGTVVQSKEAREGLDFFPLMVEFEERLYAAGIIKGSRWIKREGRPTDDSVLTGRMIDRSIRPLFNQELRSDVQVVLTVLSVDKENDYDIVSLIAASAALAISGVDWRGPIGGVRVGLINDEFVYNPTYEQQALSSLDLIVAGTSERVLMIEAGANEIPEAKMEEAIIKALDQLKPAIDLIKKMQKEVSADIKAQAKVQVAVVSEETQSALTMAEAWLNDNIKKILFDQTYYTKGQRKLAVKAIKEQCTEHLLAQGLSADLVKMAINKLAETMIEAEVTQAILTKGQRVDGRKLDEIRELTSEVGILPRNHGAGLFSRGETQVMSIVTLGPSSDEQTLEGMEGQSTKRYMHHYNFPGYCVGEAKPNRGLGRREIGHGALAEKALLPVIPSKEDFPYTIRVVSETLSSNGSSSMGSTCGSTLALMDAGVPIKKPVAGIAIGLASNADMSQWKVLTDIQDLEDGEGGMDFKITGTKDGITAIQLDTKTIGLSADIVKQTLAQGKKAIAQILETITKAIPEPRKDLSPYAPRITSFHIDPEKIREVIGQGGKMIHSITDAYDVTIDIEDDGLVMVCGTDAEKTLAAVTFVKNLTRDFVAGEVFKGKVVRMLDFGAFIELTPGRDGMAHVSELAPYRVSKPEDFLSIGDEVYVKIIAIDEQNRVNLTMKGLPENEPLWKDSKGKQEGNVGGFGNGFDRERRDNRNGDRSRRPFRR